jgi:hypothetical protein
MEPKTRDFVGVAALVLTLAAFALLLVVAALPG